MASPQGPLKKPRLSLQIKTSCSPVTRSSRSYAMDPKDPTAFNTLSNVYVTAVGRAPLVQTEPITAINTLEAFSVATPADYQDSRHRVTTPYVASYPETPSSDTAPSPQQMEIRYPSTMTATPPLSAGPVDLNSSKPFSFSPADVSGAPSHRQYLPQSEKLTPRRPQSLTGLNPQAPYTHPRSLHSILRNSPLPPPTAIPPPSPRRQSQRLQERANRRVGYNNPLTQEIITNKYTKSHIDLLVEEASPHSPPCVPVQPQSAIDLALAFTPNEIRDGGQTPGPFEDMRRRMAGLGTSTPLSPSGPKGILKRKRKDKKRRWVWTIGQDDDDDETVGGSIAALRTEAVKITEAEDIKTPLTAIKTPEITFLTIPTPSIESTEDGSECLDVDMSDTSSCLSVPEDRGLTPSDMDMDLKTPTAPQDRDESVDVNRDTPVPPELMEANGMLGVGHIMGPIRDSPVPPEIMY
ncbi:hypothetical protein FZEAL_4303 [Fusarium zealandicum]|uniref:Glucan 4-alpha-glucosidase n=1 Tax=Fusarium zealandicum TaxID=1053134 RepID=A0A8H4XLR1_9HYPO|nr:hypothetical protein FZEAL_4303 [Fusarium zealandicum]